jgi:hypothetical protein
LEIEMAKFSDLLGVVLTSIVVNGEDDITFKADDGRKWIMHHRQDCCECVTIEDVVGDMNDLIGHPILEAEEAESSDIPPRDGGAESYTWTFYKIGTIKGRVTIRWYGSSNGWYSESVDFDAMTNA